MPEKLWVQVAQTHSVQVVRILQKTGQRHGVGQVPRLERGHNGRHLPVRTGMGGHRRLQLHQGLPRLACQRRQTEGGPSPMVDIISVKGPSHIVIAGRPEHLPDHLLRRTLLPAEQRRQEKNPVNVAGAMHLAVKQGLLLQGLIGLPEHRCILPLPQPLKQGLVLPPVSLGQQVPDRIFFHAAFPLWLTSCLYYLPRKTRLSTACRKFFLPSSPRDPRSNAAPP